MDVADDGGPASYRPVAGLLPVAKAEEANCQCSVFTAKDEDKIGDVVETEKPTQRMRSLVRGEGGAVHKLQQIPFKQKQK